MTKNSKEAGLEAFNEQVDDVIQHYLHFEGRIPTFREIIAESQAPTDLETPDFEKYIHIVQVALQDALEEKGAKG